MLAEVTSILFCPRSILSTANRANFDTEMKKKSFDIYSSFFFLSKNLWYFTK